ncbi:MAG: electron transfer flavoprotein subunit alpha/FixB family protein [Chloroflexi bacterium]|nr:electron transfer flavoprotein subunit alpha/FixB family protein [Chloroflexota bacterium]
MANQILIVPEEREGALRKVSFELITVANELAHALGGAVDAAIIGSNVAANAQALATTGIAHVYAVDDSALALFAPETYTTALTEIIRKIAPSIVLFGATGFGKELGSRVAARLGWGLVTDCVGVKIENGALMMTRPIYAGKAMATVKAKALPVMLSVRPNIFPPAPASTNASTAPIENVAVSLPAPRARVVEKVMKESVAVDLAEAKVVVSGGRGVKNTEGFEIVKQLANTLGAAVGASRAAVDAGWIDYSTQVGQTGKTVAPQLYIAAGISGAIQHLAGMSSSKVIVAINKDPDAPIFQVADYGIVGDLFQVLPVLNEELKKVLAEK